MSKIYEKRALFLRTLIGEASDEEGNVYELAVTADSAMLVKSKQTGRTFNITWQDVLELAVEAGINEQP